MSFRTRLTLFFVLIVVLPMIAVAVLVSELSRESRTGKADARLSSSVQSALAVYGDQLRRSRRAAHRAAVDDRLTAALRERQRSDARDAARRLVAQLDLASLAVLGPGGRELARAGSDDAVAESDVTLRTREGTLGSVLASRITAESYAARVQHLTERGVAVLVDGKPLASTLELGGVDIPASGDSRTIDLPSGDVRVATARLGGAEPNARLAVFGPIDTAGVLSTRPLVLAALVAFFAIALLFIVLLVRSLQGQIAAMLAAARRIGGGDFSREVPVEGRDEMAGLARELNKMSERLSEQMGELRRQRAELERSVRRIGDAFAHGLDREALLDIVAETALAACDAESCRIVIAGRTRAQAEAGLLADGVVDEAMRAAEGSVLQEGGETEVSGPEAHALACALTGIPEGHRMGAMSIARHGTQFESGQRELFRYLAGQASVSVENVDLHELVSEQAITDELTGLSNQRRFTELIGKEAARAERFGHGLSLLILDIDDFKQVNDAYGHLQGDEVLRALGHILLQESRGVDEPARYGGEEFVVALPETGPVGGLEVAERIRGRIESTQIQRVDGSGTIRVTASMGVASMPEAARDVTALIAVADAALYRAKRAGKNRCEQAAASNEPSWSIVAQGQPTERRT
ncbi:MAG TPA: diguanylate cyclase [Solirubrobacterales bacterium]|nr:diguanylate cyclase [Solirubrobacterales bacterium]